MVDAANGILGIEWIDGESLREIMGSSETGGPLLTNGTLHGLTICKRSAVPIYHVFELVV